MTGCERDCRAERCLTACHKHVMTPACERALSYQKAHTSVDMSGRETVQALLRLINTASEDAMKAYEQHGEVPALDSPSKHPLDLAEDAVALRKAVRVLEGACEQLCDLLAPPPHTIINVSSLVLFLFKSHSHFTEGSSARLGLHQSRY